MVPSFRSILFERLRSYNISEDVALTVLEEISICTSIFLHKQRKAERAALDAARRSGRVIYLEPGAALRAPTTATPTRTKPARVASGGDAGSYMTEL